MAKLYKYTVIGQQGAFPLDMLHYDCYWPSDSLSVDKLTEYTPAANIGPIKVDITSYNTPTIDRWRSFGWSVNNLHIFKQ